MTERLIAVRDPGQDHRPNAGIMLLNAAGQVFVGRRIDSSDAWQMPQGGIDPGENPRNAALRELEEEVGTDRAEILFETDGWFVYDFPEWLARSFRRGRWRGQAQKWFVMRFSGTDNDIKLETAHPEFADWQWVERSALSGLIVPFKRPVYEAVLAEVEPKLAAFGL